MLNQVQRIRDGRRYLLNTTNIKGELGLSPTINFDECLPQTAKWCAEKKSWWEPSLNRRPLNEPLARE
jgi:dTDP-glucose 4,6-dehydratase